MNDKSKMNCLLVVVAASFLATFNTSALSLSIPGIEETFSVSAKTVGWAVTMYTLTNVAFSLPGGKFADKKGQPFVMKVGLLSFAVGSFIAVLSGSFAVFLFARFLQGVGGGLIFCTGNAMVSRVFDKEERGKALGYATASIYLGLSLGPVIGGVINNWFGWKTIILLVGVASAVTFVIACRTLPMLPASADMTINGMSCMLYIAGIVLSMYGFSNIGSDLWNYLILALGVILCVVFIRHESSVKNPILQVGLFKGNRAFTFSGFAALLNYAATYAVTYYLSIYLQMARGYSSQWAGMLLIVAPIVQTALSPVAGRLSDRMSPFKLSSLGMGICTLSLILLALVGQNTSIGIIVVLQMLLGCGYALFSSPNTNAIMSSVSKDNLNLASSVLATMRTIGQTMSMGIVTIIVGLNMGSMAMSEASQALIVSTMKVIFIVFALICAAGVFLSNKRE